MMRRFFYILLIGIAGHQSDRLFCEWEKGSNRAWPLLGRYAVGGILIAISTAIHNRDEAVAADIMAAAVPLGAGVATGYVIDSLFGEFAGGLGRKISRFVQM